MLKIDYINKTYNLDEIIEAYTDGSIDNFKGDKDFLTFLISYAIGQYLEGPDASEYQEYAKYDGGLNIMLLDEYGILGVKLYRMYEICNKNKQRFIELCALIGKYTCYTGLNKNTIELNLSLKQPVDFIDDSIILSDGKKPQIDYSKTFPLFDLDYELREEYEHELERSLRHRINESIVKNGDNLKLLEEMPSYTDKIAQKEQERKEKEVQDNYIVNINNLFYGYELYDATGIHMRMLSFFEYTNIDMFGFHLFRSIPVGEYCLLDDTGKIHIPETILNHNDISVGPNCKIRSVKIANIPTILSDTIKKLEVDPISNEESILNLRSLLELLEARENVSVGEIKQVENVIRAAFNALYSGAFINDKDRNYKINPDEESFPRS